MHAALVANSRSLIIVVVMIATALLCACSKYGIQDVDLDVERTFYHPVLFQLRESGGTGTLRTVVRSGAGGYDHGSITSDQSRTLSEQEIAAVRESLERVLASLPAKPPGMLLDGSTWSLTVRSLPRRKFDVRSPDYKSDTLDSAALYDFGLTLWRISQIPEPEKDLY